jgi:hypothetical protein
MTSPASNRPAANLYAAITLAAAGIFVFPARATFNKGTGRWDKQPLVVGWQDKATADQGRIEQWWRINPDAIPGIELGRSGLIVIDADRHGGPDGVEALAALLAQHETSLDYPITRTAGGGEHHVFRQPHGRPLGNSAGALPKGIDVRGKGGWIVAPCSVRPDGAQWLPMQGRPWLGDAFRNQEIPRLPSWLIDIIRDPGNTTTQDNGRADGNQGTGAGARERAYAAATLNRCANQLALAEPGSRNNTFNSVSYTMRRMAARNWASENIIFEALLAACETNNLVKDDGFPAIRSTFQSGFAAGLSDPHPDLTDSTASAGTTAAPEAEVEPHINCTPPSDRGYFLVERCVFDDPSFKPETYTEVMAWLWLVGNAVWTAHAVHKVKLKAGQLSYSVRFLADRWNWGKSTVHLFLGRLREQKKITYRTSARTGQTVITICNYHEMQRRDETKWTKTRSKSGTAAGQRPDTTRTNKNSQHSQKEQKKGKREAKRETSEVEVENG